jgi:hypothetical protein
MLSLDLINLIDGFVGLLAHGRMHRFTFSTETCFTGVEVELLLRQYGIPVWGRAIEPDNGLSFLVKRRQAVWAEYILCRAGVPLTCELLDPRNESYRERHAAGSMPTPWDERGVPPQSPVGHVIDWLHRLIG